LTCPEKFTKYKIKSSNVENRKSFMIKSPIIVLGPKNPNNNHHKHIPYILFVLLIPFFLHTDHQDLSEPGLPLIEKQGLPKSQIKLDKVPTTTSKL